MAKFKGIVGYGETQEVKTGKWDLVITERPYSGDVVQNLIRNQSSENVNDDFFISNKISIISDPYAYQNFRFIKYVTFMGVKWKVTDIEVLRPRIILTLGGVWNENTR